MKTANAPIVVPTLYTELFNVNKTSYGFTKKGYKWNCGAYQENTFSTLKGKLISSSVLAVPDFNILFYLQTNSSQHGLEAGLTQLQNSKKVITAYVSRTLNKSEMN